MGIQHPQRGTARQFSAHVYCGQTAGWINIPLCMAVRGRPRPRRLCVRWDSTLPPKKKGTVPPNIWPNVYCRQTAGWIKMPLGTEVGLGPGDVVLDGYPAPPKRGTAPCFRPMSIVAKRLDGWGRHLVRKTEVDLGPGHIVLDGDPAPPPQKGHSSPLFSADIYCGHGRTSQLLLSSCSVNWYKFKFMF